MDEKSLLDYVSALSDWLEPHHNHVRPSPAAVLAEATKNSAGAKTVVASGNGHAKKDEEAPTIKDAPESVTGFFTSASIFAWHTLFAHSCFPPGMQARLQDVLATNRPSSEALHVATLTQEVIPTFCLVWNTADTFSGFCYVSHRDSAVQACCDCQGSQAGPSEYHCYRRVSTLTPSLLQLVQRFKTMRAQAAEILREMSTELLKISENAGGIEARKVFVDACEPITDSELVCFL